MLRGQEGTTVWDHQSQVGVGVLARQVGVQGVGYRYGTCCTDTRLDQPWL
jgi:hypothetical protein